MKKNIDKNIMALFGREPHGRSTGADIVADSLHIAVSTARHHLALLAQRGDLNREKVRVNGITSYRYSKPIAAHGNKATNQAVTTAPSDSGTYLYRGEEVQIPEGEWQSIATDGNGDIYVYGAKPFASINGPWFMGGSGGAIKRTRRPVGQIDTQDWKESAQCIDSLYRVWHGGECPVAKGTLVDVIHRSGEKYKGAKAGVSGSYAHEWSHRRLGLLGESADIVAYRLSQPVQAEAPNPVEPPAKPYPDIPADQWPEWAKFHANDENGRGWFYAADKSRLSIFGTKWMSADSSGERGMSGFNTTGAGWKDSLIERPVALLHAGLAWGDAPGWADCLVTSPDYLEDGQYFWVRYFGEKDCMAVYANGEKTGKRKKMNSSSPESKWEIVTKRPETAAASADKSRYGSGSNNIRRFSTSVEDIEPGIHPEVAFDNSYPRLTHEQVEALLSGNRQATCATKPVTQLVRMDTDEPQLVGVCDGKLHQWDLNGDPRECHMELRIAPITHERFINVYPGGVAAMYYTQDAANQTIGAFARVDCIRIEWQGK